MLFSFIILTIVSIFVFKRPELWFFWFCLFVGVCELSKGVLFGIASSFYLGSLLAALSLVCTLSKFSVLQPSLVLYIGLCFAVSSFATYVLFSLDVHLVLSFCVLFVTLYGYLLTKKLISFEIFIDFVVSFLLLLILTMLSNIKWRK